MEEVEKALAQQAAIAALAGAMLGILRVKTVLDAEEVETVFDVADSLLPPALSGFGSEFLEAARDVSRRIKLDP